MPILGILASSITGGLVTDAGAMFPIRSYVVPSGGVASVTFSSIPSTYSHLQIRMLTQLSGGNGEIDLQFNSDTGSNYSYHRIYGNGSSAVAEAGVSTTQATVGYYSSATSVFNGAVVDILDYANTNKYKTIRSLNGMDTNGGGLVLFDSSSWRSTSAISSITVFSKDGSRPLAQYSSFALFGVKA